MGKDEIEQMAAQMPADMPNARQLVAIALEHELQERALERAGRASLSEADLAPMEDRTEELRSLASQCLTLARTATDPQVRASLVLMARSFHELATRPPRDSSNLDSCRTT